MRSLVLTGVSLGLVLAACSSGSHPGALGSCTGSDAAACTAGGSGGSGGSGSGGSSGSGGDGGGGFCTVDPTTSQCQQWTVTNCCADVETCEQDSTCRTLLGCVQHCLSQGCVTSCEQTYAAAAPTYDKLTMCMSRYAPCTEPGIGDPCSATGSGCLAGASCSGLWCTRTCTKSADCAGTGPGGGNITGQPGACRRVSAGAACYPGCSGDPDCTSFPGTYCLIATDVTGATVQVCATGQDAGTD